MTDQPGWGEPPTQAPKKKHRVRNWVVGIVGGLFAIGVISSVLGGDPATTTTSSEGGDALTADTSAPADPSPAASKSAKARPVKVKPAAKPKAHLPVTATDGKFRFAVTRVKPGVKKVGDQYLGSKAQGQFVIVSIKVKNIGNEQRTFDAGSQKAFDAAGREFTADSEAGIYLDDSHSFLEGINPGNSVTGQVVFDIPKKTKIARLELHDSMFSGGVDVALP